MLDINDINQVELAALPRCVVVQQPLHRSCALQFWRDFSTLSTWRGGHRASPKMLQIAGQLCKNQKILMWQVQTLSFSFLMFFFKVETCQIQSLQNLWQTLKLYSYSTILCLGSPALPVQSFLFRWMWRMTTSTCQPLKWHTDFPKCQWETYKANRFIWRSYWFLFEECSFWMI